MAGWRLPRFARAVATRFVPAPPYRLAFDVSDDGLSNFLAQLPSSTPPVPLLGNDTPRRAAQVP